MVYEYDIQRADAFSDQMEISNGMGVAGWRLISASFNSIGNFYILYFERLKLQNENTTP